MTSSVPPGAPSAQPSDQAADQPQPTVPEGTRVTYYGSKETYRGLSGQVVRSYEMESDERRYDLYLDLPEGGNQIMALVRRSSFMVDADVQPEPGAGS